MPGLSALATCPSRQRFRRRDALLARTLRGDAGRNHWHRGNGHHARASAALNVVGALIVVAGAVCLSRRSARRGSPEAEVRADDRAAVAWGLDLSECVRSASEVRAGLACRARRTLRLAMD